MASHTVSSQADRISPIARRYGQAAAQEWQRVLSHFALGDGFALIVLIVPDRDGAQLCRDELQQSLTIQGKQLTRFEPADPLELRQMSSSLLDRVFSPCTGAAWIAAIVPRSTPDFREWEAAWHSSLEGLNQQRNPMRRKFDCPLVIVAAPWVVPLFREAAPDLWSVRSQVVWIEPDRNLPGRRSDDIGRDVTRTAEPPQTDAPDPVLALREAERLRRVPDRVRDRANLLVRAGVGLLGRNDPAGAEAVLREAADLLATAGESISRGIALHELGRAILDQGRAAEAEATFRRALTLAEEGGGSATLLSLIRLDLQAAKSVQIDPHRATY